MLLLLLLSLLSIAVAQQTSCRIAGGQVGTCTNACARCAEKGEKKSMDFLFLTRHLREQRSGIFMSSADGASGCEAFANSIKCCVTTAPCSVSSRAGVCTATCGADSDHVSSAAGASGCGAFASAVRCCVRKISPSTTAAATATSTTTSTTTAAAAAATTTTTAVAATSTTASVATTAVGIPQGPACVAHGRSGACVNLAQCPAPLKHLSSGAGVSGCGSFAADIKCCAPASTVVPPPSTPSAGAACQAHPAAIAIIKEFEGFYAKAYPDPLSGNLPITIGYGSTRRRDGSTFKLGDVVTRAEAEDLLAYQIEYQYCPPHIRIPTWAGMNSNQQSALLSFAYNLGAAWYGNSGFRSLTRVVGDRSQWSKIRATLQLYRNPGSRVEAGLLRRRNAEADLFLRPLSSAAGLAEAPIPQEPISADEDEDRLDPALHTDGDTGMIIGIVVAVVLAVLILAIGVYFVLKRRIGRSERA